MISVAVVEDNTGVRSSLELLLNDSPGFRCVCACATAEDALQVIPRHSPEIVLMDIHLPNRSGIECTAQLKSLLPEVQIIMITVYTDVDTVFKALRAGASGYLLKRSNPEQILEAITEVRQGGAPMTREIARKIVEAFKESAGAELQATELTRRENEVLEFLSRGYANKEIAHMLSISLDTVRFHLKQIYEKLHVRSRTEAVAKFIETRQGAASSKRL
ncbi:MAG: DNA-binding response regulator [Verrucomicrobia bacterium]|nr:MAG: DNA-binding response regulator [Verrucomicrobiota bacterium]